VFYARKLFRVRLVCRPIGLATTVSVGTVTVALAYDDGVGGLLTDS